MFFPGLEPPPALPAHGRPHCYTLAVPTFTSNLPVQRHPLPDCFPRLLARQNDNI
jgi:hypothetical protein